MGNNIQQIPEVQAVQIYSSVTSLRLIPNTDVDLLVLWHGYSVTEKLDNTSTVDLPRLIWEPT